LVIADRMTGMEPLSVSQLVKQLARRHGCDVVGICPAGPIARADFYRQWLAEGRHGQMAYLARNQESRADPRALLPSARSAIVVGVSYHQPDAHSPSDESGTGTADPSEAAPDAPSATARGRVAMYAWGSDYHDVLRARLRGLVADLRERLGVEFDSRICVDTAPILERELAAAAGLGWIGKNTMLLHPRLGSYLFLGVVLTSLDLAPDEPMPDRCGQCRKCLDACPTQALHEPHAIDARLCISYLTIELRDRIPENLRPKMGDWVFGCDVCQQACPYNRKAPAATDPAFAPNPMARGLELTSLLGWDQGRYAHAVRGSAMARARLAMMRRNAAVALGNVAATCPPPLAQAADDDDPMVAEHARWAVDRIRRRHQPQ